MRSWWSPSPDAIEAADPAVLVRRFVEASRRAEIIALVNSARTDREVARVSVDELCEALEAEIAFVVVTLPERGKRETIGAVGLTPAQSAAVWADDRCREALGATVPVVHGGADLLGVGAQHLVLSPWTAENGRQVVIGVGRMNDDEFDPAEVALLEAVTASVGHALERSWLSADRDRHAARQSAIARAATRLSATLDARQILETLCTEVRGALEADVVAVYAVEEYGLRPLAADGAAVTALPAPVAGDLAADVAHAGTASALQPFETLTATAAPGRPIVRAGLAAPMWRYGTVVGVVDVGYHGDHWVEHGDVELLVAFAELAALATRNAADHAAARRAASIDALTGCLNHGAFQERLREEIARAARGGGTLALALVDLDDFKGVNDTYGHLAGDAYLRDVADALRRSVRRYDRVARYGGDEFAVLLPTTDRRTAREVLDRALTVVGQVALPGDARASASAGIGQWRAGDSAEELVARADRDLLAAKARRRRGRWDPSSAHTAQPDGDDASTPGRRFTRRAALLEGPEGTQLATLAALAGALQGRDAATPTAEAEMAAAVGCELGMGARELRDLRYAALLHDIGRFVVPETVLAKPAALTAEEQALVREHAAAAESILAPVTGLAGARRIIRHAHERWDGDGYPDGLRGEAIPLGSRIVLAVDAYRAMRAERPHRAAQGAGGARAELRRHAGTQFDPRVVDALLRVLDRRPPRDDA